MRHKRRIAALTAGAVMCLNLLPSLAVNADEAVSISTVSDLKKFTEQCVYDQYSENKKFVLQNDIDLNGETIKSAGVFCGTFEGNGHSIKNIRIEGEGSKKGLFSKVSKAAQIKDLNVTGEIRINSDTSEKKDLKERAETIISKITEDEDSDTIKKSDTKGAGGIAGYNEGKIVNCSFGGKITGQSEVGGIAGTNAMTGIIDTCSNGAEVNGDSEIGGVAGYNEGRIKLSKNTGKICPNADEKTVNTGGIAGESKGAVVICTNEGNIGGKSFGDNVGGIAGKQSGEIRECINNGSVTGRRSVGGVCGRFEPYTDIELSYESAKAALDKQIDTYRKDVKDAREKIVDLFDELTDGKSLVDAIFDRLGIGGKSGDRLDRLTDSAISALDSLSGFSDETKEQLKSTGESIDSTLTSVDNFLKEFDGKGKEISDSLDELTDALNKGEDDVDEIKDKLFTDLDDLDEDLDHLNDNLDSTHAELKSALRNFQNASGTVTDTFDDIDDSVTDVRDRVKKTRTDIENLKQKVQTEIDDIKNNIPTSPIPINIPTALPSLPTVPPNTQQSYSVDEGDSLQDVYDVEPSVVGKIRDFITPSVYAAKDDDKKLFKELKSTDLVMPRLIGDENADTALIRYCVDNGRVEGSEYVGGVAGSMGFESVIKTGESVTLPDGTKIDSDALLKALVDSCISYGNVKAKSGYAGGAVGKCDIGDVRNTLTTGEISSEEGSYVGGTAGYSEGNIKNCIAVNDLDGKSYIGGIAGSGKNIETSYALPRLDGTKENNGAIAGFAGGNVSGTYFIDEGLSGIDGASFHGVAQAVKPDDIAVSDGNIPPQMSKLNGDDFCMEGGDLYMPQIKALAQNKAESIGATLQSKSSEMSKFHFKVTFTDKDKELKSLTVDYGTTLNDSDIPRLTAAGTEVPKWDKNTKEPIIRHTKFTAVYNQAMTTLSSNEEPPLLLVESVFDEGTEVELRNEGISHKFRGYEVAGGYSFTLTKNAYDKIRVHIRDDEKKAKKIAVSENGKWQVIDCTMDGSYAVFEVGAPCTFAVLYKKTSIWSFIWVIPCILALIGIGGGAFIYIRRKKDGREEKKDI